jgi:hypothetical protein
VSYTKSDGTNFFLSYKETKTKKEKKNIMALRPPLPSESRPVRPNKCLQKLEALSRLFEQCKGLGWTRKGCVISSKEFEETQRLCQNEKFLPHTYEFPYIDKKNPEVTKWKKVRFFPCQTEKEVRTQVPPRSSISADVSYLYQNWNRLHKIQLYLNCLHHYMNGRNRLMYEPQINYINNMLAKKNCSATIDLINESKLNEHLVLEIPLRNQEQRLARLYSQMLDLAKEMSTKSSLPSLNRLRCGAPK